MRMQDARKNISQLVFALVVLGATFDVVSDDGLPSNMEIFILAGQSNMSGRGKLTDLPAGFPRAGNRIWVFTNAYTWELAREPLDSPSQQVDKVSEDTGPGVGPGLAFADALAAIRPQMRIGLVPCAKGGTDMKAWTIPGGRETLYGSCLHRAREAAERGHIAGILWYQGESDAVTRKKARKWNEAFVWVVYAFRRDLGNPILPVVYAQIGRLSERQRSDPRFRYWEDVKRAQSSVKLNSVAMINAGRAELSEDGLHLSTKGYLALGRDFAERMVVFLK